MSGLVALLFSPIIYGLLMWSLNDWSFLTRMAITFVSVIALMSLLTMWKPMKEPFKLETTTTVDLRWSKSAVVLGVVVFAITIALYYHYWDFETPMFEGMFGW